MQNGPTINLGEENILLFACLFLPWNVILERSDSRYERENHPHPPAGCSEQHCCAGPAAKQRNAHLPSCLTPAVPHNRIPHPAAPLHQWPHAPRDTHADSSHIVAPDGCQRSDSCRAHAEDPALALSKASSRF